MIYLVESPGNINPCILPLFGAVTFSKVYATSEDPHEDAVQGGTSKSVPSELGKYLVASNGDHLAPYGTRSDETDLKLFKSCSHHAEDGLHCRSGLCWFMWVWTWFQAMGNLAWTYASGIILS